MVGHILIENVLLYISSFFVILLGFPRPEYSLCRLGCTVTVPRHRRALDKIRKDVDAFVFWGAVAFSLAPPSESGWGHTPIRSHDPLLLCGVPIDSFPSVHGGSPWALPWAVFFLYLVQWWLPVHTDCGRGAKAGMEMGKREEETTITGGQWRTDWKDGCGDREKVR